MASSSLVSYQKTTRTMYGKRTQHVTRITPHVFVGQYSVETMVNFFASSKNSSANYVIAADGRIGGCLDENYAACTSSNRDNDNRAVTIECASEKTSPYALRDACYQSLIKLCVDICDRYGKTKLLWLGSKEATLRYTPKSDEMVLTAHRWFANKACPGDWLYGRYGQLAAEVTNQLNKHDEITASDDYSLIFDAADYKYYYKDMQQFDDLGAFFHFLGYGMKEGRKANIFFDPEYYKKRYGDLQAAFGNDWPSYYIHYMRFGYSEGRWPMDLSPIFNLDYYQDRYADLRAAFGSDSGKYVVHFMTYGMIEGRQACASFNPEAYRLRYSDLNKAFGDNMRMYYKHYLQYGMYEGRNGR